MKSSRNPSLRWIYILVVLTASAAFVPESAVAASPSVRGSDKRLRNPVSTRVVNVPLTNWLEQLGRQTGVLLRTAPDYADRAVTVRVSNLPLGDLMDALAALYGDYWRPTGAEEAPTYILESALATRQRQWLYFYTYQGLLIKEVTNHVRHIAERGPAPWQLQFVHTQPEAARDLFKADLKARASVVAQLSPEALSYLLKGGHFRLRLADTDGKLGTALWDFVETFAMPASTGWTPQARANAWVHFSSEPYTLSGFAYGLPLRDVHFYVGLPGGRTSGYNLVINADAFAARLREELALLQKGEEQDAQERSRQGGEALRRLLPAGMKPQPGTPAKRSELLAAIAEAGNLNLVSDAHSKPPDPAPALGGRTVEAAMSAVCDTYACRWRVKGSVLLVRSEYWWIDDMLEPPASAVARWQTILEERGVLSLEEASRMAQLSPGQQQRIVLQIPEAAAAFNPWLELYGRLNPAQQQAARSGKGLEVWRIPEPVRLRITRINAMDNPYLGVHDLEDALRVGSATLKVTPDATVQARPAALVEVTPIPNRAGHVHGKPERMGVVLPRRAPTVVGRPAPILSLRDLQGELRSLDEYRGKVVVVNFFAPGCEPCHAVAPHLEKELWQKRRDRGLVVVGISIPDSGNHARDTRAFLERNRVTYPVLLASDAKATTLLGIRSLPANVVLDREGKVTLVQPNAELAGTEKVLRELMPE